MKGTEWHKGNAVNQDHFLSSFETAFSRAQQVLYFKWQETSPRSFLIDTHQNYKITDEIKFVCKAERQSFRRARLRIDKPHPFRNSIISD